MLNKSWYDKGRRIRTAEEAKDCEYGFIIEAKHGETYTTDKIILIKPDSIDKDIEAKLNNDNYVVYERIKVEREPIFSEEVDKILNNLLTDFIVDIDLNDYYHSRTPIDLLLKKLKNKLDIVLKENKQ